MSHDHDDNEVGTSREEATSADEGRKRKSSAQVFVADGAGGMRPAEDLRFDKDDWPLSFDVPAEQADAWMLSLDAEVHARGWNSNAFSQQDRVESSGTIQVHVTAGPTPSRIEFVWERARDSSLHVRARSGGDPPMRPDEVGGFLDAVAGRVEAGPVDEGHHREILEYYGLPWRGELWLDDRLRLGPPSKHPEALLGNQAVIVDSVVKGIGPNGVRANFDALVQEVRVFLGIVIGIAARPSRWRDAWVPELDESGKVVDCSIHPVGYSEVSRTPGFPSREAVSPVERRAVERPGLGPFGIRSQDHERWVPGDIEELWEKWNRLPADKGQQLMRAGNAYLLAQSMWPEQRTAYGAFLVVACEALKPTGRRFDRWNVYNVVQSILGDSYADELRQLDVKPQDARSGLVHRGELLSDELEPMLTHDYFADPSHDEMLRLLSTIARTCLIEWLRQEGNFARVIEGET